MVRIDNNDYIDWLNQRAMRGRSFFTKDDFEGAFGNITGGSRAVALSRLVEGGWIVSPWRNFYVIVPIQYKLKGEVPPSYYIDELMKFLGRKYYVSLLTAAGLHGAGHQRAMSFFVTVDGAPLRNAVRSGTKLLMFQKKDIDLRFTKEVRTEGGYMNVSSPLMTALDLVQDERKVGGLSRVAEVLYELMEVVKFDDQSLSLMKCYPPAIIQRLGYILTLLEYESLADELYELCKDCGMKFRRTALKASKPTEVSMEVDGRWKVIINQEIDIDEI